MNAPARSVVIRVAFVLAAAGTAYLIGLTKAVSQNEASGAAKVRRPSVQSMAAGAQSNRPFQHNDPITSNWAFIDFIKKDPVRGVAELARIPSGADAQAAYRWVFAVWAGDKDAAPAAADAAFNLPAGLERNEALHGLTKGWANSDAKAALDWASGLPPSDTATLKEAIIDAGTANSNRRQPELAAQYVDFLQDASARNQAIQAVARAWAGSGLSGDGSNEPGPALEWLDQVATGDTYDNSVKDILSRLGPSTAASLLDNVTEPGVREDVIANLASRWGGTNPQAALDWAQALPDSDGATRDQALLSITSSWAKKDPLAVAAAVQAAGNPSFYLPIAPTLAQAWAAYDPQGALTWTAGLPEGDAKNQALNNALVATAKTNFDDAWSFAASLPENENPADIMGNLVGAMAKKDLAQAAGLLEKFPDGPAQINATSSVAAAWALQNPAAFSQWAQGLAAGVQHDAAVSAALAAAQATKLPAPERAALVQKLTPAPAAAP